MRIDWGAFLPDEQEPTPALVSNVPTYAPGATVNDIGIGADREALEERAGDDRRYCPECGHYRIRFCAIAKPGGLVSARRNYEPVHGILRRCEGYAPLPTDPDQRTGAERWPWLIQPPFSDESVDHTSANAPTISAAGWASG